MKWINGTQMKKALKHGTGCFPRMFTSRDYNRYLDLEVCGHEKRNFTNSARNGGKHGGNAERFRQKRKCWHHCLVLLPCLCRFFISLFAIFWILLERSKDNKGRHTNNPDGLPPHLFSRTRTKNSSSIPEYLTQSARLISVTVTWKTKVKHVVVASCDLWKNISMLNIIGEVGIKVNVYVQYTTTICLHMFA